MGQFISFYGDKRINNISDKELQLILNEYRKIIPKVIKKYNLSI